MTRRKFSTKVVLLATAIGLSTVAFAGSQPAAAQSYTCSAGTYYDPTYGCTGYDYGSYYGGYYGYPTILYGQHPHHDFGHMGIGADRSIVHHSMGDHSLNAAHFGGGGFGHGMSGGFGHGGIGMGIAGGHNIGGGFGHGMAGGFGHGGGGGHR
jgi:hypothetical protein